jgi:hypothetical protein
MSLEQASYLSQVIAALAIIASLVFVGFQIRQNTRAQRLVAVNSLAAAGVAINIPAMESPAFGEALSKALADWGSASREQRIIAHYFLFSFFKLQESAWYQHRMQALDAPQWRGWENLALAIYHTRGVQSGWWPHRRNVYSPEYQDYLARSSPEEVSVGTLEEIFGNTRPPATS